LWIKISVHKKEALKITHTLLVEPLHPASNLCLNHQSLRRHGDCFEVLFGLRIASRVALLGTLTSKGTRFSSAMRNISKRMASDTDSPIASNASDALILVSESILART